MEFDRYGRLRNPGISSTEPVNTYTHYQNSRSSSTFFLWDWFNDLVIGIGNFIADHTETIIGILAWIAIIVGGVSAISLLIEVWSNNNFLVAALITVFGGGILYYVFMIILGLLYWIVSIALVVLRYIFYNAFTLLLVIGLWIGIAWYNNRDSAPAVQQEPVRSSFVAPKTSRYRCTATTLNVRREPSTGSPVVGQLHRGDYVEVYEIRGGFAHIKYGDSKAWASITYLEKMF